MSFFSGIISATPVNFAESLVDKIAKQFPPASEHMLSTKGGKRRLENILEHVMIDIDGFQEKKSLGIFGKARLGNRFRWGLIDKGYSVQFAEALTEGVIQRLTAQK